MCVRISNVHAGHTFSLNLNERNVVAVSIGQQRTVATDHFCGPPDHCPVHEDDDDDDDGARATLI